MTKYNDPTHLPENINPNVPAPYNVLAKNVRNKMFGEDVRESIAQSIEGAGMAVIEWQNAQQALTVDSEVINARISLTGEIHQTLKKHLDSLWLYSSNLNDIKLNISEFELFKKDTSDSLDGKRDKNVTIGMSDLGSDVKAEIAKDKTAYVAGKEVAINNFVEVIQKDIGEYYEVTYSSIAGGWTIEGKEDNSAYAKENYQRTEIDLGPGEIIKLNLNLTSTKRIVFIDSKGKDLGYLDKTEKEFEFSGPNLCRKARIQYYKAGSITPLIERLTYVGISSKGYVNRSLLKAKEEFYYSGELGGQRVLNQNLSEKMQIDTGKPIILPIVWKEGGWNADGTENNSTYAKENYVRAEYKIEKSQTGRPLKLVGKWSIALEIVRTFDIEGKKLQELTSTNQSELVFSVENKTTSVKVQSYRNSEVYLSHYVYDSTASQEFVIQAVKEANSSKFTNKEDDNIKIIYHRGFNDKSPEQTKHSFVEAKKRGAIWVECDVLLTKDNVPVIHHDDTINRTARNDDGSKIKEELKVKDLTLEEIKQYDFGIAWGEEFKGERILTLEEFLKLCYQLSLKARLEIKQTPSPTYLQHFGEVLENSPMVDKVELCSASTYDMNLIKNRFTKHDLILVGGNANDENLTFVKNLENAGRKISFGLMVENIDKNDNMNKILSFGIKYEFWTVDSKENLDKCLSYYPIGITTNHLNYYEALLG